MSDQNTCLEQAFIPAFCMASISAWLQGQICTRVSSLSQATASAFQVALVTETARIGLLPLPF
jgi:hypothetical protein